MDNQENDIQEPQPGAEVSPGVTPIHDETEADLLAEQLKAEDVEAETEAEPAAHNVFENQGTVYGQSVPTEGVVTTDEADLDDEKPYEGGCAS